MSRRLTGTPSALVVVLGPGREDLVAALRAAGPGWTVHQTDSDVSETRVDLALIGPADVIVDSPAREGRLMRFRADFFHLRAAGAYVVPGGADELGPDPSELGRHLQDVAGDPPATLRVQGFKLGRKQARELAENQRVALRMHVHPSIEGRHLVLTHDLPDVLVKLTEPEGNAYLARLGGPHRVVKVLPAEPPPDARVIVEGPDTPHPAMDEPINEAELALRDYRDVAVDIEQVVMTDRVLLPDSFRHNQWRRLRNRRAVDVGPRFAVPRTPVVADLPRLEGTYLHLDNEFRGHFGHVMTETLSRVWSWAEALAIDPDVKVLVGANPNRPTVSEWEYAFYEACGIPRDRVVLFDRQVRVERLLSGTPMFSNPHYVHPRIEEIWDRVGDTLAAQAGDRERPKRIFIARRIARRSCTNAAEVEKIFADHGFTSIYPEDHPLGEQVALFRAADVVGGFAGSGLFNLAFVPRPMRVVQLRADSYTPRNEVLMAAVRGHHIQGVVSRASDSFIHAPWEFDLAREGPYLRDILESLP